MTEGKELKKEMNYTNECPNCKKVNWKEYRDEMLHDYIKCLGCGHTMLWVEYLLLREHTSLDVFEASLTKEEQNEVRKLFKDEARRDFAEQLTNGLERFYIDKGFICKDSHTRINIGNLREYIKRKLKELKLIEQEKY